MKCQHEWRYVPASNIKYGYYTCQKCDVDMSETQYEAIQQARQEAAMKCLETINFGINEQPLMKGEVFAKWLIRNIKAKFKLEG